MPRCREQSIPSSLLAPYLRTLSPTRYDLHGFGSHPLARDLVAGKYTEHPAQGRDPSPEQLAQRARFKAATDCWPLTTPAERAAYFQVATWTGEWYYNFFIRRTMAAFKAGKTWAEIARPNAIHFDLANGATCGWVDMHTDPALISVHLDLETAPTTDNGCESFITGTVYQVVRAGWYSPPYTEYSGRTAFQRGEFGDEGLQRYTFDWSYPNYFPLPLIANFTREGDEQTPCVLWDFTLNGGQPNLELTGFVQGAD